MLLMNKNVPVLQFELDRGYPSGTTILTEKLLPELLKLNTDVVLYQWLANRSVDLTRSNARLLLKMMNIRNDELSAVLANKALSLTDTYWVKEENDKTLYEEVSLYRKDSIQMVIETSLSGMPRLLNKIENPELTNIGSYDKAWIKEAGEWWLRKKGSPKNVYAELFTSLLGSVLGMNVAGYCSDDLYIQSLNFTDEEMILEHYNSYRYKFDNWDLNDDKIIADNFNQDGLKEPYLDILLLDGLVCNPDRHDFNFGVIKNPNTGEVLNLAPNYDNNLALGAESGISTFMLKDYLNNFGIQKHQKDYIEKLDIELIKDIDRMVQLEYAVDFDTSYVFNYFKEVLSLLSK